MAEEDLVNAIATGDTLDDFLISLASGVATAQNKLLDISRTIGSKVVYQIPQLEFELKLQVSTMEHTQTRSASGQFLPRQTMRVATPVGSEETTAASTIKGTLVAIPIDSGKPKYVMDMIFSETANENELDIKVTMLDISGSPQKGVDVEVNIDREESYALNKEQGIDQRLQDLTQLLRGVITTDDTGVATGRLQIDPGESAGMLLVITADALGESKSLNYRIVKTV